MPETSDPRPYRVSTVGWLFARAAFRDAPDIVDQDMLDRIVERAIEAFQVGNVHHTRALFYLATPTPRIAAQALDALGMPPRPRRPYTGPSAGPVSPTEAAGLLDRLPDGGVTRPLTQPVQAQALAWEDARRDRDGRMLGVYAPVPVVWPPGLCQHGETICPHCLITWADNHTLALFEHGPDGGLAGCQCPICHPDPGPPPRHVEQARPSEPVGSVPPLRLIEPAGPAANPQHLDSPDGRRPGVGGSGMWLCGRVEAGGVVVGLGVQAGTGLTLVCYPASPAPQLGTGPHLAVVAVLAEVIDQLAGHHLPARPAVRLISRPPAADPRGRRATGRRAAGGDESDGGR